MGEYEKDSWYWIADPREGDVWHPVFIRENDFLSHGKPLPLSSLENLRVEKAILPEVVSLGFVILDSVGDKRNLTLVRSKTHAETMCANCNEHPEDYEGKAPFVVQEVFINI